MRVLQQGGHQRRPRFKAKSVESHPDRQVLENGYLQEMGGRISPSRRFCRFVHVTTMPFRSTTREKKYSANERVYTYERLQAFMCLVARSFERGVVAKMGQKPIYDKPFSPHLGTWKVHNRLRIGPQRAGLVGGTHWWGGMLYIACSQPENRVTRIAHVPSNPGPYVMT